MKRVCSVCVTCVMLISPIESGWAKHHKHRNRGQQPTIINVPDTSGGVVNGLKSIFGSLLESLAKQNAMLGLVQESLMKAGFDAAGLERSGFNALAQKATQTQETLLALLAHGDTNKQAELRRWLQQSGSQTLPDYVEKHSRIW